jgi:hypothetical protein
MNLKLLAAAALSFGLLAHATPIVTTTLNVTISSNTATANDYLLFYANGVAGFSSLGTLPSTGGIPVTNSYTVPGSFTSGYATVVGLATPSDVVVALGSGISTSSAWSTIFLANEATIATDIATANTSALTAFLTSEYAHNSGDFVTFSGTPGTGNAVEFSNNLIGSLTISTAPEPSTIGLLGCGICALFAAKKKNR